MVGENNNNNNSKQNNFKYYNKSACATSGSSNSSPKSRRIRNQTYFQSVSQPVSQPAMQAWSPNHTINYTFTEPLPSPAPITIYSICRLQSYIIWGRFVFMIFCRFFFLNWEKIFDFMKSRDQNRAPLQWKQNRNFYIETSINRPTKKVTAVAVAAAIWIRDPWTSRQTDGRTHCLRNNVCRWGLTCKSTKYTLGAVTTKTRKRKVFAKKSRTKNYYNVNLCGGGCRPLIWTLQMVMLRFYYCFMQRAADEL